VKDAMGSAVPVLWQLKTSVFCEKGRWALDYKGVAHRRRDLMPGLHSVALRLRGRGATVPVLDLNGRSLRDSTEIVAALEEVQPDPPLYPADPSARDEARYPPGVQSVATPVPGRSTSFGVAFRSYTI
jgi:glutathione S-transferase